MKPVFRHIWTTLFIFIVAIISSSCASNNYLVVNYQLPIETVEPQGTSVSLVFKDVRQDKTTLTLSAKKALNKSMDFFYVLVVSREGKDGMPAGAYNLGSMIREVFKQRLENAGVRVAPEGDAREFTVEILLKAFQIDLVERKWVVSMTYQANFLKQGKLVGGETINGRAERLRVIGDKDAEMILGELITDVANKIDLSEFLKLHEI